MLSVGLGGQSRERAARARPASTSAPRHPAPTPGPRGGHASHREGRSHAAGTAPGLEPGRMAARPPGAVGPRGPRPSRHTGRRPCWAVSPSAKSSGCACRRGRLGLSLHLRMHVPVTAQSHRRPSHVTPGGVTRLGLLASVVRTQDRTQVSQVPLSLGAASRPSPPCISGDTVSLCHVASPKAWALQTDSGGVCPSLETAVTDRCSVPFGAGVLLLWFVFWWLGDLRSSSTRRPAWSPRSPRHSLSGLQSDVLYHEMTKRVTTCSVIGAIRPELRTHSGTARKGPGRWRGPGTEGHARAPLAGHRASCVSRRQRAACHDKRTCRGDGDAERDAQKLQEPLPMVPSARPTECLHIVAWWHLGGASE